MKTYRYLPLVLVFGLKLANAQNELNVAVGFGAKSVIRKKQDESAQS